MSLAALWPAPVQLARLIRVVQAMRCSRITVINLRLHNDLKGLRGVNRMAKPQKPPARCRRNAPAAA